MRNNWINMNQLLQTMDGFMNSRIDRLIQKMSSIDPSPIQLISPSDCPEGKEFKWVTISLRSDIEIQYSASDFPEGKEFTEDSCHNYYSINEFSNYLESKRMGYTPFNPPLPFHLEIPRNRYGHIVYKGLLLCIRDKVKAEFSFPPLPDCLANADEVIKEEWVLAHTPKNELNEFPRCRYINIDEYL